jgi:hypothetical protein
MYVFAPVSGGGGRGGSFESDYISDDRDSNVWLSIDGSERDS